jgi:hypothetical protein
LAYIAKTAVHIYQCNADSSQFQITEKRPPQTYLVFEPNPTHLLFRLPETGKSGGHYDLIVQPSNQQSWWKSHISIEQPHFEVAHLSNRPFKEIIDPSNTCIAKSKEVLHKTLTSQKRTHSEYDANKRKRSLLET